MITVHSEYLDAFLRNLIKFVKRVPGFRSLPLDDRTQMIKASWSSIALLGCYRGFNKRLGVALLPRGHSMHRDDLYKMFNGDFVDAAFDLSHDLQQMNCCLNPTQTVLLKCLALTSQDLSGLSDPAGVTEIRRLLLQCLRRSLRAGRDVTSTEDCAAESLAAVFPIASLEKLNTHSEVYKKFCMKKPLIKAMLLLNE